MIYKYNRQRDYYYQNNCNKLDYINIDGSYSVGFRWDTNGNMISNINSQHFWDEENRMMMFSNNNQFGYYMYDASGERTYKLNGNIASYNMNGQLNYYPIPTMATLYVSPYLVASSQNYTKHYYAGTERVASKIGGGGIANITTPIVSTDYKRNSWTQPYANLWSSCLNLAAPCSTFFYSLLNAQPATSPETALYFYHSDHLGSASWITDSSGSAIQHLQYLPFGETWVDQRITSTSWNTKYSFSAKEKDEESRYSYFGARYYDSELSIWLSVDPMASEYPSTSAYAYCNNSPLILIDPNGMEWTDADGNKITDHTKIKVYIFYNPEDFGSQSKQMYKDAVAKYGEGSVAMSNVTTTSEFAQDWGDMASNDIKEVNINHHGGPQTLTLDAHVEKSKEYITATGTGKTPAGRPAMNVESLPTPSGNIQNARLNINSCKSNNTSANLKGSGLTLAQSFRNNTDFRSVRATPQNVSYHNWFSPNRPHPQDGSNWQFLHRPTPLRYPGIGMPPK